MSDLFNQEVMDVISTLEQEKPPKNVYSQPGLLNGISASSGVAIGRVVHVGAELAVDFEHEHGSGQHGEGHQHQHAGKHLEADRAAGVGGGPGLELLAAADGGGKPPTQLR